ncbi:MAG: hypothetical protein GX285_08580 [Clostridiales bacterium]|nr:hypothetical protein [Clostridiales bacterium]
MNKISEDECSVVDKQILIKLSNLTKGKILDRRREIRKNILLAALSQYQANDTFEYQGLIDDIYRLTKCRFEKEQVLPILSNLENEDVVESLGEFTYRVTRQIEIPDIKDSMLPVWNEFLQEYILNRKIRYDPHIHRNAQVAFNEVILKIISQFTTSEPFENQVESIPIENLNLLIKSVINDLYFSEDKFKEKLQELIFEYLTSEASKNQNLLTLIYSCYGALIDVNLLKLEQEFKNLDIDFSNHVRQLLLDTNFIITLLTKTDSKHSLSVALVKQCNKSSIPLMYSSFSKVELNNLIRSVQTELATFGVTNRRSPSDNQLILDYFKHNKEHQTSWSQYSAYLDTWESVIQKNWNIQLLQENIAINKDSTICEVVKIALKTYDEVTHSERVNNDNEGHYRQKSEESYNHDAYSVAYISKVKLNIEQNSESKPYGPWFLSYDNRLSAVNKTNLMKINKYGYVIQPRILLNYLHTFTNISIDENEEAEFALALLRYTARVAHPKLTLDEYSQLVAIKIGIGEENTAILKEIFLQSPLIEELQRALTDKNSELADRKAVDILNLANVQEMMEKIGFSQKEKRDYEKHLERLQSAIRRLKNEQEIKEAEIQFLRNTPTYNYYQNISIQYNGDIVNIQMDSELDSTIKQKFTAIIQLLESEGAYESNIIEPPPSKVDRTDIQNYLREVSEKISRSPVAQGLKDILPIISSTISIIKCAI